MCSLSQPNISYECSIPSPKESLPNALLAEARISGIESKREFLMAGTRIPMYGSKSYASYVREQMLPISVAAICLELLSCMVNPASSNGTSSDSDGASIACAN
jgi:hypothetical protein